MRHRAWRWLVSSSCFLAILIGATRPRYGGSLTVELSTAWSTLNPSEHLGDAIAESKREVILPLIVETLVRLDSKGEVAPGLASAWQHDADHKRWRFSLRPKVLFHDGEPLTAASAEPSLAASLKHYFGEVTVSAGGQTIVIHCDRPMPDLLQQLARTRFSVFRSSEREPLIGTGPFRVTAWDPQRRLNLSAFDQYWNSRPFIDSVIINLGASRAVGDIFDIPFAQTRRVLPEHTRIWASASRELIAIEAVRVPPETFDALDLVIDRGPMVNVLGQRRAEAAFGLLPQWLSGYAFLFNRSPDVASARQIATRATAPLLSLSYPANDGFARSIAERVALNARDAGIIVQPTDRTTGSMRLIRWSLESRDAAMELQNIAGVLGLASETSSLDSSRPEELYQAERRMLESHRIIPVLYLPDLYGIAPRVHNWSQAQQNGSFSLHLDNLWVEP